MYWQTQTADASVCSEILGWKESSSFTSREEEIQLKDLEKIPLDKLCLLHLHTHCSSGAHSV